MHWTSRNWLNLQPNPGFGHDRLVWAPGIYPFFSGRVQVYSNILISQVSELRWSKKKNLPFQIFLLYCTPLFLFFSLCRASAGLNFLMLCCCWRCLVACLCLGRSLPWMPRAGPWTAALTGARVACSLQLASTRLGVASPTPPRLASYQALSLAAAATVLAT